MGAFIGYGDVGVWANNRERDAFLDWYAEYRCKPGDTSWAFCKSGENRWTGCGIELSELIPNGEAFTITDSEFESAASEYWPAVAELLAIVEQITTGKWNHSVSSPEAVNWRSDNHAN